MTPVIVFSGRPGREGTQTSGVPYSINKSQIHFLSCITPPFSLVHTNQQLATRHPHGTHTAPKLTNYSCHKTSYWVYNFHLLQATSHYKL